MKIKLLFIAVFLLVGLSSCKKFLDAQPEKGKVLPKTLSDYEQFLNDILLSQPAYVHPEFMGDDLLFNIFTNPFTNRTSKSYTWQTNLLLETEDDNEWNTPYSYIYACNLVLDNLATATNGTDSERNRLKAEALVQRAYYHFNLANLYGKDYVLATASTDLAVPLMLKADLEAKVTRATVQQVYDQVITDLNTAISIPEFPDFGRNFIHPGKVAAMALLARVYLFKGDYSNALKFATDALAKRNTLLDWNTLSFSNPLRPSASTIINYQFAQSNVENIFTKTAGNTGIFTNFMISSDLLTVLGEKDLRYVYNFTRLTTTGAASPNPNPNYLNLVANFSIGVPEMMLIRAECLARSGDKDGAIFILNNLRLKRFKPVDYVPLTAINADDALRKVIEERRRELFYRGIRWFDLKRLNRDDRFKKTITHTVSAINYNLEPNSSLYILPIPPKVISINPLIIPNQR